ncbi:MAG: hypothetical protein AAFW67_04775 [Cyanobacteria bacterium J06638_38]
MLVGTEVVGTNITRRLFVDQWHAFDLKMNHFRSRAIALKAPSEDDVTYLPQCAVTGKANRECPIEQIKKLKLIQNQIFLLSLY